jgi:DNA gyrase subunit B
LYVNSEAPPITGQALSALSSKYVDVMTILDRLSQRRDRSLFEQMIYLPEISSVHLEDDNFLADWAEKLQTALSSADNGSKSRYEAEIIKSDEGVAGFRVHRMQHGVEDTNDVSIHFFESPEYAHIVDLGKDINGLIDEGAYVTRGEQRHEILSFKLAVEWLMAEARKGQMIQRYKGLGEMNPDQLWDTTVNPETRRLMQVRIEDAVAADEIFTTLMGDQVEPRRQFIERYALTVENLDV